MYFIVQECLVALVTQHANAPLLYGHLWPAWIYHIFPTYLINGTI